MKASVQYNDYVGTSAADLSDHHNLDGIAKQLNLDTSKYSPVGFSIYSSDVHFSLSLICNEIASGKLVKVTFENSPDVNDVLKMFKRLNVVFTTEKYLNEEIEKEIHQEN